MRAKLTILLTALLVLALGASQAYAQAGGYDVLRGIETVAQHGKNQQVGTIRLDFDSNGGIIDAGATITVTFGGLPVAVAGEAACANGVACADGAVLNDDKDTITIATDGATPAGNAQTITLTGVRVDVSSLDAGDNVMATISTTAPSGLIPVGQSRRGTVTTEVAVVMGGLTVGIDAASRLICNLDAMRTTGAGADGILGNADDVMEPVGGVPSITVTEGFNDAWEQDAVGEAGSETSTHITIKTLNLPAGVDLRWPASVTYVNPATDDSTVWATLTLVGDGATQAVVDETSDTANDGSEVMYEYSVQVAGGGATPGASTTMDSFEIPIQVVTGDISTGAGGIADIWAFLSPAPADDDANISSVLSYVMSPVTDPMTDMGDFLNIAECVTYLLFPYITCGAHADWDTGISIANTSMDDGIFGLSDGATAQRGPIYVHAYPTGAKGADHSTADGYTGMATTAMISGGLAAGDSIAMQCGSNEMLAGMQGYAIVKAGFRHAHGMAFVMNLAGGAVNAVHGYVALVIPDPEFGGDNAHRAAAEGESLGH